MERAARPERSHVKWVHLSQVSRTGQVHRQEAETPFTEAREREGLADRGAQTFSGDMNMLKKERKWFGGHTLCDDRKYCRAKHLRRATLSWLESYQVLNPKP